MLSNGYNSVQHSYKPSTSTINSVSSSSTSIDQKMSPIRQHPIFKQVDEELKKLRVQFDTIRSDQVIQQSPDDKLKNKSLINLQAVKPSTAMSGGSNQNSLSFTTAPKINQSFGGFGGGSQTKPSSGTSMTGQRGPTKYFRQIDPTQTKVFSVKKSAFLEQRDMSTGEANSFQKDSNIKLNDSRYEENNRSLILKEIELERKQKEFEVKEQKDKEHKERETSIRKNELKKYAQQEQKVILLTKKIDGVNKQNASLQFQVAKLTAEVKQHEKQRIQLHSLRIALFEKEHIIKQLTHQVNEAREIIEKKEQTIKAMETETGAVKKIVLTDHTENAFNLAIKTSLEENQRIKEVVASKDEQIEHVREQNRQLRSQVDSLRNEIEINKLKHMADLKSVESTNDIDRQSQMNELASLRKTVTVLDQKFKFLLKEDKRKDEFMVNYFKGKTHDPNDKDLVINFFKLYEQVPKLTMSELLKQEYEIQNQLRQEIEKLKQRIEVDDIIQKELRKQIDDIRKSRYA